MQLAEVLGYAGRMAASKLRGTPLLVNAYLYPTHRCNLRCTYCNSPFLNTPELTTDQWLSVVDQLAALGCRRVLILGGEPLLRPDVSKIIAQARAHGMSCVLTTNGTLVPKQIDRLGQLNTLVLSLDAPGPANDAVRGAGVFAAVAEAVAAAQSAGLPVKINAVLSAKTFPFVDELLAFVAEHDLSVTFSIMRSETPALWRDAARIKAEDAEMQRVMERIATLTRTNHRILFSELTYRYAASWGDYGRDRLEAHELPADDPRRRNGPPCQAGRYYMTINPDGTVYPCVLTVGAIPGGNVVTDGVEAAWRQLHTHQCVACYSPCTVEQNFLFSLQPRVLWQFSKRHVGRFS